MSGAKPKGGSVGASSKAGVEGDLDALQQLFEEERAARLALEDRAEGLANELWELREQIALLAASNEELKSLAGQ